MFGLSRSRRLIDRFQVAHYCDPTKAKRNTFGQDPIEGGSQTGPFATPHLVVATEGEITMATGLPENPVGEVARTLLAAGWKACGPTMTTGTRPAASTRPTTIRKSAPSRGCGTISTFRRPRSVASLERSPVYACWNLAVAPGSGLNLLPDRPACSSGSTCPSATRGGWAAMDPHHYHLVQGLAQQLPVHRQRLRLGVCDHGGLTWASPRLAIPEAARVLRPGGRLAFNTASPWLHACYEAHCLGSYAQGQFA